jgi:transcription antitermination factor NusG
MAPHPYLDVGSRVRVVQGALAGITGWVVRYKSTFRLVVSVSILQRSVAVEIDADQLLLIDTSFERRETRQLIARMDRKRA